MVGFVDIAISQQTNDIAHENGLISYVNFEDETIQRARTCLRRISGEWFLDIQAGLPYFGGQILGGKDFEYVKLLIREELLRIDGIQKVVEINILADTKTKRVSIYAEIEINENVYRITEEI